MQISFFFEEANYTFFLFGFEELKSTIHFSQLQLSFPNLDDRFRLSQSLQNKTLTEVSDDFEKSRI